MDLKALAKTTKLPLRKLRYVVDHEIIPATHECIDGMGGQSRQFGDDNAFLIAVAGSLLEYGCRRDLVSDLMLAIARQSRKGFGKSLEKPRTQKKDAKVFGTVQIANGQYIRFSTTDPPWTSGWMRRNSNRMVDLDKPAMVVIEIDLNEIAALVYHREA